MNRLAAETSPYLLQHRNNPVDWHPWGDEAFAEARSRQVPVFVSIGYSACHWCHVMAHESFEDETTAAVLNDRFVAIKVDREERPDVDAIYMEACQALTGSGGWPLSVFCDADGRPFFAGTYFPPRQMGRTPSFTAVLDAVSSAWSSERASLLDQAGKLTEVVDRRLSVPSPDGALPDPDRWLAAFTEQYGERFDAEYGGIGTAPKFPQPPMLELLVRRGADGDDRARQMVTTTLENLCAGGIYDHLGGGFCRYSVDRSWTVPHFEKMLYDQAGLARVLLHAGAAFGERRWLGVATETIDYVLRDLRVPDGGFASAEDADSEGEEGKFYLWTPKEIDDVLGPELGPEARAYWGVNGRANFEGRFILRRPPGASLARPAGIESARAELLDARARRVRPGLDDKALTEWNAMMISTLCEASGLVGEARFADEAARCGRFLLDHLRRADGRWLRAYKDGRAQHLGLLADHGWVLDALTRLYEATGDGSWLDAAVTTAEATIELFSAADGGFYSTGSDAAPLVIRPRDIYDGVVPSASSIAADALSRIGTLLGERRYVERAGAAVAAASAVVDAGAMAVPHLIGVAKRFADGPVEIVVTGRRVDLVALARSRYLPDAVVAWGDERGPLFADRAGQLAYVCVGGTCRLPVATEEALDAEITATLVRSRS